MTGKTHKLGGILAGTLLIKIHGNESLEMTVPVITGCILGSLLPDIDHPKSSISLKLWFISWPLAIMRGGIKLLTVGLPNEKKKQLNGIIGHRGITHSLFACVCVAIGLSAIGLILRGSLVGCFNLYCNLVIGVVLGMMSHLLLDTFSNGIPLLCPISNIRIGVRWIKTGSIAEWMFAILLVAFISCLVGKDGIEWIARKH